MHYFPGIIKAIIPAMLAFYLVLALVHLSIRAMGKSTGWLPVLPRFAMGRSATETSAEFEEFIIDRFDPGHFPLVHRQTKGHTKGPVGQSEPAPGLLYQAKVHGQVIPFVVGCVWRQRFVSGILDLSDQDPFPVYHKFHDKTRIAVFIIIGVGGTGSEPQDCYIVPLSVIRPGITYLAKKFLEQYRRTQADAVLFLDTDQLVLS